MIENQSRIDLETLRHALGGDAPAAAAEPSKERHHPPSADSLATLAEILRTATDDGAMTIGLGKPESGLPSVAIRADEMETLSKCMRVLEDHDTAKFLISVLLGGALKGVANGVLEPEKLRGLGGIMRTVALLHNGSRECSVWDDMRQMTALIEQVEKGA